MMKRDSTYIDDVVEGVMKVVSKPPQASLEAATSTAPYKIYNIGNNKPVELMQFIEVIEKAVGKTALKNLLPMQPGDIPCTFADVDDLIKDVGFKPTTSIEEDLGRFVEWYQSYYIS